MLTLLCVTFKMWNSKAAAPRRRGGYPRPPQGPSPQGKGHTLPREGHGESSQRNALIRMKHWARAFYISNFKKILQHMHQM